MGGSIKERRQKMKKFEIYWDDLTAMAQATLCIEFETTFEEENWGTQPLVTMYREEASTDK